MSLEFAPMLGKSVPISANFGPILFNADPDVRDPHSLVEPSPCPHRGHLATGCPQAFRLSLPTRASVEVGPSSRAKISRQNMERASCALSPED